MERELSPLSAREQALSPLADRLLEWDVARRRRSPRASPSQRASPAREQLAAAPAEPARLQKAQKARAADREPGPESKLESVSELESKLEPEPEPEPELG